MNQPGEQLPASPSKPRAARYPWIWDVILIGILLVGGYFRFMGVHWDDGSHMHPDERFMTMVGSAISSVNSLGDYFNTDHSSLNPNNVGYGFYVYGTLPLFIVRYTAEALHQADYGSIDIVGRQLSALFDLGTAFLAFLIASRLFRSPRIGLMAAAFYSLAVLPIQLSHFYKEDTFLTFFATLSVYFAVRILPVRGEDAPKPRHWNGLVDYLLFGLAFGMAMASKVSIAPLVVVLPGAALIRWLAYSKEERESKVPAILANLVLAGVVAFLAFRIFQPYAFSGPGFFGIGINPKWRANMQEIAAQNSGDVDFPPQLQWARRTPLFSLQNMVVWGLGLPLGVLAWAGFLWMAWRLVKGGWSERGQLVLLWVWTGAYFAWQAASITRTMRYQMPVYPLLAVIGAWMVFTLWSYGKQRMAWQRVAAMAVGAGVLVCTLAWAFAFTRIYTRPFTRVDASRWIYQNVPGPVNVTIQTPSGDVTQPMSFQHGSQIAQNQPVILAFEPQQSGKLKDLEFDFISDGSNDNQVRGAIKSLAVAVSATPDTSSPLGYTVVSDTFPSGDDGRGKPYAAAFAPEVPLEAGKTYYIALVLGQNATLKLNGALLLGIDTTSGLIRQPLPGAEENMRQGQSMSVNFSAVQSGTVQRIYLNRIIDWEANPSSKKIHLAFNSLDSVPAVLAGADLEAAFLPRTDPRGEGVWLTLDHPVAVEKGKTYSVTLAFLNGPGELAVYGSKHANETSWDDALPLGVDGYDPYGYNNGIYRTDLNFEMYWDDNSDKLTRFLNNLNLADYIFISSNRQWGTTVRVPERYPLTTLYYRSLIGCPLDKDILWCYSVAKPGMFKSNLGFDLIYINASDPTLGPLTFNSQFAEEAFSVYDHPKVLIFKKNASYDPQKVRELLQTVDLSKVVHLTPNKAASYPGNLMLDEAQLAIQQSGGTWSALFNREAIQNRWPGVGAVVWYLAISLLGLVCFPLVRMALRGLPDRGYPFLRLVGMLLLAYPVWLLGSTGVPFTGTTITLVVVGLVGLNAFLAWVQRKELCQEIKERWRYYLTVELIGLAFFLLFLLVRLGNSDLWHQWKGGEKPMDFSYFNAVLKSTVFPPYDPWLSGGYINYYYYGFMLVGVPVKWLGIIPSIAYNLILPQFYSLLALGGFSVVWNLLAAVRRDKDGGEARPFGPAVTGSLFLVVMGNLGTLRMIWHGLMKLSAPGGTFENGNIFMKIGWTFTGLVRFFGGTALPYAPGDWYWIPSRALPSSAGDPITEFPAFTFLYADLHAHMLALPVTVLALAWALSLVLGKWEWGDSEKRWRWLHYLLSFGLGALAIGTLRPTNTWDFPTYLALGGAAILFGVFRYARASEWDVRLPDRIKRAAVALISIGLLTGLALLLYQPYSRWYGQGYNSVALYTAEHTPSWSYLTHWGLFLFMIVSYLVIETLDWMAKTPLSALSKFKANPGPVVTFLVLLVLGVLALLLANIWIGWLVLPLMAWAAILLLQPGMPAGKRALLFMIGTGLALTLMVEIIVLVGDINRMNTVFKFYLQAWTLLGLSAAVGLAWAFDDAEFLQVKQIWGNGWRTAWHVAAALLIGSAALFPLLAGIDKIRDRMAPQASRTLDGMTYMAYAHYTENNVDTNQPVDLSLAEDYQAIRWMQDNIQGSPVIAEGHVTEYRWGNRYTIYTGLPSVVGWNWHERQQRAITPEIWVTGRIDEIDAFYNGVDSDQAGAFLKKYNVSYIVVGQMERAVYHAAGIAKFDQLNGKLWDEVYHQGQTVIYKVR